MWREAGVAATSVVLASAHIASRPDAAGDVASSVHGAPEVVRVA